jgi:hypothetical protein
MTASTKPEAPVVLVKWYDYAKWVLERVESLPKNQKYVLGQRLSNQVMEVLELLVEASYSREKRDLLATVNRKMEVVRWTVRMCKDQNLLSASQFTHSARCLNKDIPGVASPVGTQAYADAVIANFGKKPTRLEARDYRPLKMPMLPQGPVTIRPASRKTVGCDIFVETALDANSLGNKLTALAPQFGLKLKMISNRGTQVFPDKGAQTDCVDHWRCRHMATGDFPPPEKIGSYLTAIEQSGLRWMHIEKLEEIDGKPAFTKAQGED